MGFHLQPTAATREPDPAPVDNFAETAKNEVPQFFTVESGYRFYSPELGRWLSRDPIEERGGSNLCQFAGNEPVGRIDLLGLTAAMLCEECIHYDCDEIRKTLRAYRDSMRRLAGRVETYCGARNLPRDTESFWRTVGDGGRYAATLATIPVRIGRAVDDYHSRYQGQQGFIYTDRYGQKILEKSGGRDGKYFACDLAKVDGILKSVALGLSSLRVVQAGYDYGQGSIGGVEYGQKIGRHIVTTGLAMTAARRVAANQAVKSWSKVGGPIVFAASITIDAALVGYEIHVESMAAEYQREGCKDFSRLYDNAVLSVVMAEHMVEISGCDR